MIWRLESVIVESRVISSERAANTTIISTFGNLGPYTMAPAGQFLFTHAGFRLEVDELVASSGQRFARVFVPAESVQARFPTRGKLHGEWFAIYWVDKS